MYYDHKHYKFYKPISEQKRKENIKSFIIDIIVMLGIGILLFLMLLGSFWIHSSDDLALASTLFPLLPQPNSWMIPDDPKEDEFVCLSPDCDNVSDSEFCSDECCENYLVNSE